MQKVESSPTRPPFSLLPKSYHSVFKRSLYPNQVSYMSILHYHVDDCTHFGSQECWVSYQVSISFDIGITKTVQYSRHSWVCPALPEFSASVGLSWIWALEESGLKASGVPSCCVLLCGPRFHPQHWGGNRKGRGPCSWKKRNPSSASSSGLPRHRTPSCILWFFLLLPVCIVLTPFKRTQTPKWILHWPILFGTLFGNIWIYLIVTTLLLNK